MTTAIVFLAILMTAVLVHELAHYLAARSVGVPVRAFSVGMGPVLLRRRWRGTEWRVSLLPLGGYVDLPGMAASVGDDGRLESPREGMALLRFGPKAWVLSAGVIANYLLGTLLLASAVVLAPGFRELVSGTPVEAHGAQIVGVADGSRAEALGLLPGDTVVRLNALRAPNPEQMVAELARASALELVVVGDGGALRSVSSVWPPEGLAEGERALLGVQLAPLEVASVGFGTALIESVDFGVRMLPEMVLAFVRGFGSALSGQPNEDVAGPVGMVTMVGQAAQVGLAPVLLLAALINFSLAVFNLLPIPGLDGGRLLLAGVVAVRGRPFRPGQEEAIHFAGIMAVLALIVLITVQELGGLLGG